VTEYNDVVMDHFMNPRNGGEIGDADGVGEVGSPTCGDVMKIYIKVEDGRIVDAKFKAFGCVAVIASSSAATELIRGRTLEDAWGITNRDVVEALGGLPPHKVHCSVLAGEAIHAAINDYRRRHGLEPWPEEERT